MSGASYALFAWAVLGTGIWLLISAQGIRAVEGLPALLPPTAPEPETWPRVSLIVAACDEQASITAAIKTLLAQDYPALEIVLVDDRSTDDTPALVDELARLDARVRAIHIDTLPEGWLGKVHALHRGVADATGDWLLFCDADVHLAPGALRSAIALAMDRQLDHLPVLPTMVAHGIVLEATICCFSAGLLASLHADKLMDPDSDAYAGIGAFNLVRADTFKASEGFEWLRMEVADDVGVGYLVKRQRGRTGLATGGGAVSVEWYPSLGAMIRGLEKNMFAVFGRFSIALTLVKLCALWILSAAPVVALLLPWWTGAWVLPLLSVIVGVRLAVAQHRRLGQRLAPALMQLIGVPVLTFIVLRSMIRCVARGGIVWKGTFYPTAALRAGQRVKL